MGPFSVVSFFIALVESPIPRQLHSHSMKLLLPARESSR
jgi:hypothetical protein